MKNSSRQWISHVVGDLFVEKRHVYVRNGEIHCGITPSNKNCGFIMYTVIQHRFRMNVIYLYYGRQLVDTAFNALYNNNTIRWRVMMNNGHL